MEYDRQEILIQRAELAEQGARRTNEPAVKETLIAIAELYRNLASQIWELEELKQRLRKL
jgi:hypothetical protein